MKHDLDGYRYRGARAMVLLHERQLPLFVDAWRRAKAADVDLPHTNDPSYASMQTLLRHPLGSARGYMIWMCQALELPNPALPEVPALEEVEAQADAYVAELLRGWRTPLRDVSPERFKGRTYTARWGDEYTIDAMLEHAVMHPIRHTFQLDEWIEAARSR